jgi:NAD(P)-dependent dehydrogenase (short-subunit alcohol dehydrogenase family)
MGGAPSGRRSFPVVAEVTKVSSARAPNESYRDRLRRRVVRDNEGVNAYVAQGIALGRVGQPDDVGGAIAAILSNDMGWANGTTFDISGGQLL